MTLILEMKCHGNREYRSAELLASALRKRPKANIIVSSFDIDFLAIFGCLPRTSPVPVFIIFSKRHIFSEN